LQQIFGSGERELTQAEIIDVQQRDGSERFHNVLTRGLNNGIGEILEAHMGFAIEDAITLLDGSLADGLGQMTFAG